MRIFAASHVLPIGSPPLAGGAVAVADGRIAAVGPVADLRARFGAPVADFPGCVILPGLVNAHTHLELTHYPSWKVRKGIDYSPRTYSDWVVQVVKIRRNLTPEEIDHSLAEGIRICLESGTTSVGEILTDFSRIRQYENSPLYGRLYLEAIGQDPSRYCGTLHDLEALLSGRGDDFHRALSPHTPFTVAEDFFRRLVDLGARRGAPLAIHVAEPAEEADFLHDSTGRIADIIYPFIRWEAYIPPPRRTTSVAWLESLGALTPRTACIHCVHVTPSDAEIIRRCGSSVILCPRSNRTLDVGKAPAYLFRKIGIPLALGTDSLASNDSISLWDEMRFLLDEYPDVFSPEEALEMATAGAARALHLENEVGILAEGKRADFQVVKLPDGCSAGNIIERTVHEGKIVDVYVRGKKVGA